MTGGMDETVRVERMRALIREFVDLVCDLGKVNRLIGHWDMRRNMLCKPDIAQIDLGQVVLSERQGRKNVEWRARIKTRLDEVFADLVELHAAGTKK